MNTHKRPLSMRISLNVLEHLGINLYSSLPAVLSEIVANAWDADAKRVDVVLSSDDERIEISDNGMGMSRDEVVDNFLTVGFRRRDQVGDKTPLGRRPMGRKGIGKLSIFSIARYAEISTFNGSDVTAFLLDRSEIRESVKSGDDEAYEPTELDADQHFEESGTRIVLKGLDRAVVGMTVLGLRRRIARRFSILGSRFDFEVFVNGELVGPADRGYHNLLQYLWLYKDPAEMNSLTTKLEETPVDAHGRLNEPLEDSGLDIRGWIGAVKTPRQLSDEEGENLNRIAVFMRGKLAQEDILDEFGEKEIFSDYLVGELHCDFLDADEKPDIATSSRQAIRQDDERFLQLKKAVRSELRRISKEWNKFRREAGTKEASQVPEVKGWLDNLKGDTKKRAQRWVGRLNLIRSPHESDRKELLKASILAFESYRRKEELESLDHISDEGLEHVLNIFQSVDDLEMSYYGQIVNMRVQVIKTLHKKLTENEKETVIRDYIFEHLWLLDPSWERAQGSESAEAGVEKFLKQNTNQLTDPEKKGRIDIGYRTAVGRHVIVELKRASVATPIDKLMAQIRKYRQGAKKIIEKGDNAAWPIEIICLVGAPPPEWHEADGKRQVIDALDTLGARLVFYNQLLENSEKAYSEYLERHKKLDKLWGIFSAIDDFAPEEAGDSEE